jgi:hypothetical protein
VNERRISGADLLATFPAILEELSQGTTVFLVDMTAEPPPTSVIAGLVSSSGEIVFALGPPDALGGVFALIDKEYGWPEPIQAADVRSAADLMPSYRRHPMLHRGADCLALSISLSEYELLRHRSPPVQTP